jgi:hypothetical protein
MKPIKKKKHTILQGEDAYAPVELSQEALEDKHAEHVVKTIRGRQASYTSQSMEITKDAFASAVETLERLSPDDLTVFESTVLVRDIKSGTTWREPIGAAKRIPKTAPRAKMEFEYQAGLIITALSEAQVLANQSEYDKIPFCRDHR